MKITIDSEEPLADVLRVVGSMYKITLTTASGTPQAATAPRPSKRATSTRSAAVRGRAKRADVGSGGGVDPKLVRQWAWENGHEVNARGSLPAAVRDAYKAANPG